MLGLTTASRALDINGDGLDDIWQELYGIAPFAGHGDPDGDGLINLIESISWSDPHDADSAYNLVYIADAEPADGLDDFWQAKYGIYPQPPSPLNLAQAEKLADPDGDGLTNLEESIVGSDPFTWDSPWQQSPANAGLGPDGPDYFTLSLARTVPATRYRLQSSEDLITWTDSGWQFDGDGASWSASLYTGGVPRQFYRFILDQPDDDSDGLINWHERMILGTNPLNADTDGDGLADGWEVANALSATVRDTDGDGVDDGTETGANTDPKSDQSHPPVWRSVWRKATYDFFDYPPELGGRHGTLTTSGSWENGGGGTVALSSEIAWPALSAHLAAGVPFPVTMPAGTDTELSSNSLASLMPNHPCYHATLNHRRIWLEVKPAPTQPVTRRISVITERRIDGGNPTFAVQTIVATIPTGTNVSPPSDLLSPFTSNPTGNSSHSEDVELRLADSVTINTFIPDNNLVDPRPFYTTRHKGDNRIAGTPLRARWDEHGSHRTQQMFHVIANQAFDANGLVDGAFGSNADGQGNADRYVDIGESKSFDPATSLDQNGNLTDAALADPVLGAPLMIDRGTALKSGVWIESTNYHYPQRLAIVCRGESSNPIVPGSPAISYSLLIIIDKYNNTYSIGGAHDGFPAYEIYINGSRVYQHDPLATGEGPWSLGWPPEHNINLVDRPLP